MSELINKDQEILDEYYINGYNGVKAVLSVFPDMKYQVAAVRFNKIKNSQRNQDYISEKQARLKSQTEVSNERILKELLNWFYVDATEFIGLSIDEIKSLPPEIRRCIQDFDVKEQYDKHGNHIATNIKVKLQDKQKAVESINKHLGFYAQDNDQKANKVNILNVLKSADPSALNNLLQAMEDNKD
jgi:phage terminase small subunit